MRADQEAEFTEFVASRQPALRRSAFRLCRDIHRAEDLAQTAMTKLFVSWDRARKADCLDAYAQTVLSRVYLDEQRRGWWKVRLLPRPPDRPVPATDAATDGRLALDEALAALAPRQRAVVVLRFYADLSVEQTARTLHCSTGTVKSQTARAVSILRAAVAVAEAPPGLQPGSGQHRIS